MSAKRVPPRIGQHRPHRKARGAARSTLARLAGHRRRHAKFATWFHVKLDGEFVEGTTTHGRITEKGYEHLTIDIQVQRIEPERYFAYRWHPYPSDPTVPVFAALADTTRLRLLRRLSMDGPLSITRLSEGTGVTRQAITRHLYGLGKVGHVRGRKEGREHVFSLDFKRREIARRYLDHVSALWDAAAARLKAFVEQDEG